MFQRFLPGDQQTIIVYKNNLSRKFNENATLHLQYAPIKKCKRATYLATLHQLVFPIFLMIAVDCFDCYMFVYWSRKQNPVCWLQISQCVFIVYKLICYHSMTKSQVDETCSSNQRMVPWKKTLPSLELGTAKTYSTFTKGIPDWRDSVTNNVELVLSLTWKWYLSFCQFQTHIWSTSGARILRDLEVLTPGMHWGSQHGGGELKLSHGSFWAATSMCRALWA